MPAPTPARPIADCPVPARPVATRPIAARPIADRSADSAAAGPMRSGDVVSLFVEFGGRLAEIVAGCVGTSDAVIEDACQAAWTRLIRNRDRVALQTAPGWLVRTALHEARRLSRLEARERSLELEVQGRSDHLVDFSQPAADEVMAQRECLGAIGALPIRQQRLVWLRALGLTYDEMAGHERCTSRTVRRQLERARRRLRVVEQLGLSRPAPTGPVRACDASAQPG
ncbi:MAG: RNA polymerase sigma factor [Solirubrobacteraceae bacterium]